MKRWKKKNELINIIQNQKVSDDITNIQEIEEENDVQAVDDDKVKCSEFDFETRIRKHLRGHMQGHQV